MAGKKPSKSKKPIEDRSSRRRRGPGVPLPDHPGRAPRLWEFWKGSRRHLVVNEETTAPWERRECGVVPNDKRNSRFHIEEAVEAPIFRDPRYCGRCFNRYVTDDIERKRKLAGEKRAQFQHVQDRFVGGFPELGSELPEPNPVRSRVG